MEKYHILIIDDDERIRELLKKYLLNNNFLVSVASGADEAKNIMDIYIFDLLIVDNMMPEETGLEFLQKLRNNNNTIPAIMLTALGEIENKIEGLSAGADDYICKPFEPKELVLRINNILKRSKKNIINKENNKNIIVFNDCKFDIKKNELYKNNDLIKLTDVEIKLLNIFLKNTNKILTREEVCKLTNNDSERTLDVQIMRLRKKIENDIKNPRILKTVRNKGYLFSD